MRERVDVVIVTYNSAAEIGSCLDAIEADGAVGVGVIVVDNDSHDRTAEIVRNHPVGARWIDSGGNLGYAAAVNIGAAHSEAETFFVLNPDTEVSPGAIDRLYEMVQQRGVGIAAPRITNADGGPELTIRRFPSVLRLLGQTLVGSHRAGRFEHGSDLVTTAEAYQVPGRHEWCSGAANLVDRACYDEVGPWNEEFFLYSEETDFAWRASKLGYATAYEPEAHVVHAGGDSKVSPRLWSMVVCNRVRLVELHRGPVHARAFWLVSILGEALRSFRPRNRAALKALVSSTVDADVERARKRQEANQSR